MTKQQTPERPETLRLQALRDEMRTIQRVAGQASVEGPQDDRALMAEAEADRVRAWADELDAVLSSLASRAVPSTGEQEQEDSSPGTTGPKSYGEGAPVDATEICYRCQMRLPLRLTRSAVGPRGGVDAVCAACSPEPGPDGEAKRAEVVAMRKARW